MHASSSPDGIAASVAPAGRQGAPMQERRLLRLRTPLGPDALFAEDLQAWEGIGPGLGPALDGIGGAEPPGTAPWSCDLALGPTRAGLRLVVHALAEDAFLALERLIGQPALVELLCQDSATDRRPWHGHIVAAALVGSDGGWARYRLVVEPWLAFLAHAVDARSFQDRTVPQILDEVFGRYAGQGRLVPAWRWDLADAGAYPRRSLCAQHHESDLDFVQRLLREEGLFCWWEHAGDAQAASLGQHTLVFADHNGAFAAEPPATVRFTASDHTLGEDGLERWTEIARVTSARVALRSRDHRSLGDRPVEAGVGAPPGTASGPRAPAPPLPGLAIVDVPGDYAYPDLAQGRRLAARQAEALAAQRHRALARGPWRRARAGAAFVLADHPRHDGRDAARDTFVILAAEHRARNDLTADERARLGGPVAPADAPDRDAEPRLHEVALLAQPLAVAVRMGSEEPAPHGIAADGDFGLFHPTDERGRGDAPALPPSLFDRHAVASLAQAEVRLRTRPTVRGVQTALVVGDGRPGDGADLHTDRDGRVRVQFHWQRGSRSSHRLAPRDGAADNAPASAASGTWVRVGQGLAGANFGAVFTPRIGQEVLVDFIGGDIDRPVVVGAVYNGRGAPDAQGNQVAAGAAGASGNAPAWFPGGRASGEHEGHRHPSVLLGHKSQELGSSATGRGGSNQLVFDDSAAGNRIELSSAPGDAGPAARLQLGALLHQQDNQRLAPRGHGLELATAAHGALRAGSGLLVSAHAQPASTGSGQQLESRAAQHVLQGARDLVRTLAKSAGAHQARSADEPAAAGAGAGAGAKPGGASAGQLPAEQGLRALGESLAAMSAGPGGQTAPDAGAVPAAEAVSAPRGDVGADAPARAGTGTGTGTGANAGMDSGSGAGTVGGGAGSVTAWSRPELVLAAPAGIGLFTPAAAMAAAGTHITLCAGQDLLAVAQGRQATVARDGAVLYTHGTAGSPGEPDAETGIALHAATGSVHASSNTGATRLTASGSVEVASSRASVRVASPRQIRLSAAGAALEILAGSITIRAPGAVRFKASMKVLTGAARACGWGLNLPVAPEIYENPIGPFNVRFAAIGADDVLADAGFVGMPYVIRSINGSELKSGFISETGRLPRVETDFLEEVVLHLGNPDEVLFEKLSSYAVADRDDSPSPLECESTYAEDGSRCPAYEAQCQLLCSNRYSEEIQASISLQQGEFLEESVVAAIMGMNGKE
jgi:type VI secretion system secreted protein VgrG